MKILLNLSGEKKLFDADKWPGAHFVAIARTLDPSLLSDRGGDDIAIARQVAGYGTFILTKREFNTWKHVQ